MLTSFNQDKESMVFAPRLTLRQRFKLGLRKATERVLSYNAIDDIRQFRACNARERVLFSKIKLLGDLGLLNREQWHPDSNSCRLLFVCFGNIMRSPMCEALMKQALPGITDLGLMATSAGLNAQPGRSAPPMAVAAAQEFGISLSSHKARLLTGDMLADADAVFVMDYENLTQLLIRFPQAKGKAHLLGRYAGEHRLLQIRDPYFGGRDATPLCYRILNACIQNLARRIAEKS